MERKKFRILVASVGISGISQGMLLPVLAIILEKSGASAVMNGIHATGIALGVLFISPFLEKPMRKYGFKPIIIYGGLIVILALFAFPIWKNLYFWFVLRFLIGVGDHMVHYGSQTWLTSTVPQNELGKKVSLYGLVFGIGFMIGPAMTSLLKLNETLPFLISGVMSLITWGVMLSLTNELPKPLSKSGEETSTYGRYKLVVKMGWAVLLAPLGYGLIEASLNSNFPVYALRMDYSLSQISLILPAFALGGIITQIPLGALSDRIGGRIVVPSVLGCGGILFIITSLFENNYSILFILIMCAGMAVGSTFSLGLKYMAEVIPLHLLPTSNTLFGIAFSMGSILGPTLGGFIIEQFAHISLFFTLGMIFLIFFGLNLLFSKQNKPNIPHNKQTPAQA